MRINVARSKVKTDPHILVASIAANVLAFAMPLFLLQIYDRIIPNKGTETLTVLAIGVFVAIIVEMILRTARSHLMALAGDAYEQKIQNSVFEQLLKSDLTKIEKETPGVHLDRISSIDRVRDFRNGDTAMATLDMPFVIVFLVVMTIISPIITAVIVALLLASVVIVRLMQTQTVELSERKHDIDRRRFSFLIEVLNGVESIKSFNLEAFMERRYERLMGSSAQISAEATTRANFTQSVTGAIGQVTPVIVAGTGAILVIQEQLTVGALAAAILLATRIVQPVLKLTALQAGDDDVKHLEEELHGFALASLPKEGARKCERIDTFTLSNITYKPDDHENPLFDNLNLELKRGEIITIDGEHGSGRSVLLWMMTGYLAPSAGQIRINGVDIHEYQSAELRSRIAYLPQQSRLIEGSVIDNMTRFQPEKYLNDALTVAASLGLDSYFAKHQEGLNTKVGRGNDAGLPTSVAERIPLVGALVGNPDLVLFDEANANLDVAGDARLKNHLASLKGHATIIMVTQRPSYAALADRHLRLENGHLVPTTMKSYGAPSQPIPSVAVAS